MLTYIDLDVTTLDHGIIVHGVNCQHAMGSGIAGAIKKKWPEVYKQYMSDPSGKAMLGLTRWVDIPNKLNRGQILYIVNAYTQEFYGHDGQRYADPKAIQKALSFVFEIAYMNKDHLKVYMPRIGCGLGGLDYDSEVKPIYERLERKYPEVEGYVCEWPPKEGQQ